MWIYGNSIQNVFEKLKHESWRDVDTPPPKKKLEYEKNKSNGFVINLSFYNEKLYIC